MNVPVLQSLRFRLIASVVVIEVVMLTILVLSNLSDIQRAHMERLSATAESILKQFSSSAAVYIAEVDYAELEEYSRRIADHKEIAYLQVFSENNKEVVRIGRDIPQDLLHIDKKPNLAINNNYYDVRADILLAGRKQGSVLIGFTTSEMKAAIQRTRTRSILIAATEIILSVFVTILIGVKLTQKLTWLSQAATKVGKGQLQVELPVKGNDEIAQTAVAFNKMVNELNKYHSEMESVVALRTSELGDANKELETFCHSVSHDLRSPLRAIAGFSKIIQEDYTDKLDEEGADYLTRICDGASKMDTLINDMLELSSVKRKELEIEEVDISLIAREITDRYAYMDKARCVEIDIEDDLISQCDRGLVIIIMENLIGNAWKYTSKKENAIIKLGKKEMNGKRYFYVEDNGAGFDMAYVDKLFEPFKRLHGESEFPGSGVGLATVARAIKKHEGEIWADSVVNKGTTVYFKI